jgi:hypothetical protein
MAITAAPTAQRLGPSLLAFVAVMLISSGLSDPSYSCCEVARGTGQCTAT